MQILKHIEVIFIFFVSLSFAADQPISAENLANQISGRRWEEVNRDLLPKGREQEVLEVLRKERCYPVLFRLNDQPGIDEFIAKYRKKQEGLKRGLHRQLVQDLESCKAPYILDELAASLYGGPDLESLVTREDYMDFDHAVTTARVMAKIIASVPEFSESVRKSVNAKIGEPIETMRAWWEDNEKALREERYGDVKPVVHPAPQPLQKPGKTPPTGKNAAAPTSSNAPASTPNAEAAKPAAKQAAMESPRAGRLFIIGALAAGILAAIAIVLRGRKA